ncbi:AAA family ATPase [Candidatus Saccharibacteria bacterium]|nr:MAG: AAA family ATPase [Candidatus Saccharibacteria bacterium]PID98988.1 MAG: AAA family ATPase [Candidatus Saccharibacteria bacterium]
MQPQQPQQQPVPPPAEQPQPAAPPAPQPAAQPTPTQQPVAAQPQPADAPSTTPPTRNFQNPTSGTISESELKKVKKTVDAITDAYTTRVVGQENLRQALLISMLTGGHVLLESVPGLAKTTAAQTLAHAVSGSFKRIQCTPDLLPSDIIGTQIYDYAKGEFRTELGPVHANIVLLDEINRSSAKTQSAMLEAMQEKQTSIGGKKYMLPNPFVVLATQNPIEQEGTYELPEAQLDRFLLKEVLLYPTSNEELEILKRIESGVLSNEDNSASSVTTEDVVHAQQLAQKVYVDDSIKTYIVQIVTATRSPGSVIAAELARYVQYGASPRASIAFLQSARALALLNGRDYVIPEDVKALRYSVLRHRIILNFEAVADQVHSEAIIDAIINAVTAP